MYCSLHRVCLSAVPSWTCGLFYLLPLFKAIGDCYSLLQSWFSTYRPSQDARHFLLPVRKSGICWLAVFDWLHFFGFNGFSVLRHNAPSVLACYVWWHTGNCSFMLFAAFHSSIFCVDKWVFSSPLNSAKSVWTYWPQAVRFMIVRPRGRVLTAGLPSTVSWFTRVDSIKVLSVAFSRKFSVLQHVIELLATCSKLLFVSTVCQLKWMTEAIWRDFYGIQHSSATVLHW